MLYLVVPLVVLIAVIWGLVAFPSLRVVAVVLVGLGFVLYFVANERASREQKQQEVQKKEQEAQKEKDRVAFGAEQKVHC
jgi:flagellar biosynthesis component FlhA